MYLDPTYILLLPGLILAMIAQAKMKSAYQHYSREESESGYAGMRIAQALLQDSGVDGVEVVMGQGQLTDHYDPRQRKIVLSPGVYSGTSVAAVAIAAHETGHAIQHSESYIPLSFRSLLAPGARASSTVALPLFFIGLILGSYSLTQIGIYLFTAVVIFQLVTLPVEFNASRRALSALGGGGYVTEEEYPMARKVLSAAALTYVASLAVSLLQLMRLLALSGRRRR
ncbi:MAG: zinc metallopeptidase [Clostridiales bacterium]|nr:zinc metallopeptidase [Clostridiales bacterium]